MDVIRLIKDIINKIAGKYLLPQYHVIVGITGQDIIRGVPFKRYFRASDFMVSLSAFPVVIKFIPPRYNICEFFLGSCTFFKTADCQCTSFPVQHSFLTGRIVVFRY